MFVLWAALGLARHAEGITPAGLARNAGFVILGWFTVAAILKTYARPGVRTLVSTWAAGVTLGVVARWIALRRPIDADEFAFLLVTLIVTLVLLATWRVVAWAVPGRRR
jgi:hypothetical protein